MHLSGNRSKPWGGFKCAKRISTRFLKSRDVRKAFDNDCFVDVDQIVEPVAARACWPWRCRQMMDRTLRSPSAVCDQAWVLPSRQAQPDTPAPCASDAAPRSSPAHRVPCRDSSLHLAPTRWRQRRSFRLDRAHRHRRPYDAFEDVAQQIAVMEAAQSVLRVRRVVRSDTPKRLGTSYSSSHTSIRSCPWKWLGEKCQPLIFLWCTMIRCHQLIDKE